MKLLNKNINQKVIARSFEVTQGVVGEAGAFINDLAHLIPSFPANKKLVNERKAFIAAIKKQSPFVDPSSYNSDSKPIEPAAIMRVLQNTLPKKSKIFIIKFFTFILTNNFYFLTFFTLIATL